MTDYWCTEAGAGSQDGSDIDNAWSISGVNQTTIAQNRLLLSGSFTKQFSVSSNANGASGSPTIIEGTNNASIAGVTGSGILYGGARSYITLRNISSTGHTAHGLQLASQTNAHTGLTFEDCIFANNTQHGFNYLVGTGGTSTLTDIEFQRCQFNSNGGEGLHLRIQDDSDASSLMTNIIVEHCEANSNPNRGFYIRGEQNNDTAHSSYFQFNYNVAKNNGSDSSGGGCSLGGFGGNGWGAVSVRHNVSSNNPGTAGGLNLFYFQYADVAWNQCNTNVSTGVDGNGILLDHGSNNVRIYGNECSNNDGVGTNAGSAIMILDNQNIEVYGNWGDGNKCGLFCGGAGSHSAVVAYHNTFSDCQDYGLVVSGNWTENNQLTVQNNIFTASNVGTDILKEATAGAITEQYNIFYNFLTSPETFGTGTVDQAPQLGIRNYLPATSPAAQAGSEVTDADGLPYLGADGRRFFSPPSMGAYEIKGAGCRRGHTRQGAASLGGTDEGRAK